MCSQKKLIFSNVLFLFFSITGTNITYHHIAPMQRLKYLLYSVNFVTEWFISLSEKFIHLAWNSTNCSFNQTDYAQIVEETPKDLKQSTPTKWKSWDKKRGNENLLNKTLKKQKLAIDSLLQELYECRISLANTVWYYEVEYQNKISCFLWKLFY